jgi:HNH endonuclease
VLAHYGYICQIQGPRCTGQASSVHHLIPSSQAPDLFWEPSNLVAACSKCNYGGGGRIASENKRATIERLLAHIEEQEQLIAQLWERLALAENGPAPAPARNRAKPAIR